MATAKQPMVQIPLDVFKDLTNHHVFGDPLKHPDRVAQVLGDKLDALVARQFYSDMLRAPTPEEAEEARQKYLKFRR